jgi:DNA-binding Lrp family transcriptional regulator
MSAALDAIDRRIVNELQGGFPICERPFAEAGRRLGLPERELIERIARLVGEGYLSRFAPMFNAERLGGDVCLCGMAVPEARFDAVADQVNAHPEVAHNYARTHALNMWFVLASDRPERIEDVAAEIEDETGLAVYRMPKLEEYYIGLKVEV